MRKIIAIWGIANIGWAALSLLWIGSEGIPDGYISPYDRLTLLPQTSLTFAVLLVGIFMLARSIFGRTGRVDMLVGWAAVLFLYLPGIAIDACPRWSLCTTIFESATGTMMDDGAGG